MVRDQIESRGVRDPRILDAMRTVPRDRFVPSSYRDAAYGDAPLPIGEGQTISQPYIVALTLESAAVGPGQRVLDVGTGSGYQAAVLACIVERVYGIEVRPELARKAAQRLAALGYANVEVRCGDGYRGWPEAGPFDAIVGAAAAPEVPATLVEQLVAGGRLVLPVGHHFQELVVVEKGRNGSLREWSAGEVRFVPMIGREPPER